MANPVLVEVTRGNLVESRHRGMVVVVDGGGRVVFSQGDVETPVFPRSACKAMQALPLVEGGAADAYGFGDKELALSCASHDGTEAHAALAAAMLAAAGRDVDTLECGAHWSFAQGVLIDQARRLERPSALHNNCSGKHAGFVCTACHAGEDPTGYIGYDHPIQREIRAVMSELTGATLGQDVCGIDGCAIPTYAVPLKGLAHGFAKMATGEGISPGRARASRRLMEACMAEPFYVAGHNRACTRLMSLAPAESSRKPGRKASSARRSPNRASPSRSNARTAPPGPPKPWWLPRLPASSPMSRNWPGAAVRGDADDEELERHDRRDGARYRGAPLRHGDLRR